MSAPTKLKGLKKNARSPGSIHNAEHHDPTGSHKSIDGSPLSIKEIIDASSVQPIENCAVVRVFNANAAVQYVWSGQLPVAPATVDATNGLAIAPGTSEVFFLGVTKDEQESLGIKVSDATVQVAVMET